MSKKVGEIFSDYKTNANIKYAEVIGLNIIKKANTLEVELYYDEYICLLYTSDAADEL